MNEANKSLFKSYISRSKNNKSHSRHSLEPEKDKSWLNDWDIDDTVLKIHLLYLEDKQALNGSDLGVFAKRLLANELEVGGPYYSYDNLYTNALIAQLFRTLGSPLMKVESFVSEKLSTMMPSDIKTYWSVSWPNSLYHLELKNLNIYPKTDLERTMITGIDEINPSKNTYEIKRSANAAEVYAKFYIDKLAPSLNKIGISFWNKIVNIDARSEISSLATYVCNSIIANKDYDAKQSIMLGVANIYAWIAYTIYDDIIDEEAQPSHLSLANVMHRQSYAIFIEEFPSKRKLIDSHFNSVDVSNSLEIQKYRFTTPTNMVTIGRIPKYGNAKFLANRALGHVLGPKLILNKLGLSRDQERLVNSIFDNYLIARQINDDLRDWADDLRNGHVSYVVSQLLVSSGINPGTYNYEDLRDRLQVNFWDVTFESCVTTILEKISKSKQDIIASKIFKDNNDFVKKVLQPITDRAEADLLEYRNSKQFLKSYSQ